jgi:hypothetical protein
MSKNEVRYLKGNPSQIISAEKTMNQKRGGCTVLVSPRVTTSNDIFWNAADSQVQAIVCHGNDTANCYRLGGTGPGDDEATVRATLGKPDEDRPPNETGKKTLV